MFLSMVNGADIYLLGRLIDFIHNQVRKNIYLCFPKRFTALAAIYLRVLNNFFYFLPDGLDKALTQPFLLTFIPNIGLIVILLRKWM